MSIFLSIMYKYFFDALLVLAVGLFSKTLFNFFGEERSNKIKEIILTSMLWAEETFGIGSGDEKWKQAWIKIEKLLKVEKIKLNEKEIETVRTIMKSNIPAINSLVYSSVPKHVLLSRKINTTNPSTKLLIDLLREKYSNKKKDNSSCTINKLKEKHKDSYVPFTGDKL